MFIFLFCQCSDNNAVREQAKAEAQQMASTTASTEPAPPPPPTDNPDSNPTVSETLSLKVGKATVKAGEQACLPVTATGFDQLIGLQFSIRWDRETLDYVKVDRFDLTDLTVQNFGDTHAELGVVALSWIHGSLQGITLPAASHLFDICFTPTGKAGSRAEVRLEAKPVIFEAINVNEDLLRVVVENGAVVVE
jgi:hypothetical protein